MEIQILSTLMITTYEIVFYTHSFLKFHYVTYFCQTYKAKHVIFGMDTHINDISIQKKNICPV